MSKPARTLRLAVAAAAIAALPMAALAQTSTAGGGTAAAGTTTEGAKASAPTGSLERSHHDWRSSKLVGASVYDTAGDSIGTVDDMLVSSTGQVSDVVLSVGGFLGIGDKLVEVPFSKLSFKHSASSSGAGDYSLVLPNASKASLKTMAAFTY